MKEPFKNLLTFKILKNIGISHREMLSKNNFWFLQQEGTKNFN